MRSVPEYAPLKEVTRDSEAGLRRRANATRDRYSSAAVRQATGFCSGLEHFFRAPEGL